MAVIRAEGPRAVVAAVPVADHEICALPSEVAGDVVRLLTPHPLGAVRAYHEDFSQTTDEEVRALLRVAR